MNCALAVVAADWWIEQMLKRCSELYPNKVTTNGSDFVIVDNSLDEELSRFKAVLIEEIGNCLDQHSYLSLTCHYLPNSKLSSFARKAKISSSYFPTSASMDVLFGKIQVGLNGKKMRELSLPEEAM